MFAYTPVIYPNDRIKLVLIPQPDIPSAAWVELAANVQREDALSDYPAGTLQARWQAGRAAVALVDGRIVHYSSLIHLIGATQRQHLSESLKATLPEIDIYEGSTGWTATEWRGRGFAMFFRQIFYRRFMLKTSFIVSLTIGMGASPLLIKLGWHLLGWDVLPYLADLFAWPDENGGYRYVGTGWEIRQDRTPYYGENRTRLDDHAWDAHIHLWVNDFENARRFNDTLADMFGGQSAGWRAAIAEIEPTLYVE